MSQSSLQITLIHENSHTWNANSLCTQPLFIYHIYVWASEQSKLLKAQDFGHYNKLLGLESYERMGMRCCCKNLVMHKWTISHTCTHSFHHSIIHGTNGPSIKAYIQIGMRDRVHIHLFFKFKFKYMREDEHKAWKIKYHPQDVRFLLPRGLP